MHRLEYFLLDASLLLKLCIRGAFSIFCKNNRLLDAYIIIQDFSRIYIYY